MSNMMSLMKKSLVLLCMLVLTACVTVQEKPPVVVNGAAGYLEKLALPQGSSITIAIISEPRYVFTMPGGA